VILEKSLNIECVSSTISLPVKRVREKNELGVSPEEEPEEESIRVKGEMTAPALLPNSA
jgi:hypothetical protein